MLSVGDILDGIADICLHLLGNHHTVVGLEDVAYAALSGLGVDPDNVSVVLSSKVLGIDWKIRN